MPGKVRLASLEVEGFRGVNRRIHVDFGKSATVFSAWNGKGKSTLLGAIEWVLFGELRFQSAENRTRDELVSLFHPGGRASVELTLSADGQKIRVCRTRQVGKLGSDIEVTLDGKERIEGGDATGYLFRLTGVSFDDFYRAAFLHQDSIRGLLTEEQRDRDEALDRLLGVEKIRDLLTSIPLRPVTTALEEIESDEQKLMERLAGAGGVAEEARKSALSDCLEAGYSEAELTLEKGRGQAEDLTVDLRVAASKYGGEALEDVGIEALEDLERVARRTKAATKSIRLSVGKESPLDVAIGRLGLLKRWRQDIEVAQRALEAARTEFETHEKSKGKPDAWAEETTSLRESVRLNEAALHVLDVHGRVVADAIDYLEALPSAQECPVCGDAKDAPKLMALLRTKVKKDQAAEVSRLNKEIEHAKKRLETLAELSKGREGLISTRSRCETELKATQDSAWKGLEREGQSEDALGAVVAEQKTIEGGLEGLRNANVDRERALQRLDEGADKIRVLLRFLRADSDFTRVREKAHTGEEGKPKGLEEDRKHLLELRSQLEAITGVLTGVATGRSEGALTRCGPDISRTYGELCNHPYFDGLKIEVAQKAVQGVPRNTYRIIAYSSKDGQRTSASSRLSTAQMNCVALSVYLSLAKVLSHNLGFVMMDDPSQNLDSEHKRALATIIKGLLPKEQLIVGTHDSEFDEFLREAVGDSGVTWFDLDWKPGEGTTLKPYGRGAA